MLQNLLTTSSRRFHDISGGAQLMYEFELPLEMLAQSLQQHFSMDDEVVDDYSID